VDAGEKDDEEYSPSLDPKPLTQVNRGHQNLVDIHHLLLVLGIEKKDSLIYYCIDRVLLDLSS